MSSQRPSPRALCAILPEGVQPSRYALYCHIPSPPPPHFDSWMLRTRMPCGHAVTRQIASETARPHVHCLSGNDPSLSRRRVAFRVSPHWIAF